MDNENMEKKRLSALASTLMLIALLAISLSASAQTYRVFVPYNTCDNMMSVNNTGTIVNSTTFNENCIWEEIVGSNGTYTYRNVGTNRWLVATGPTNSDNGSLSTTTTAGNATSFSKLSSSETYITNSRGDFFIRNNSGWIFTRRSDNYFRATNIEVIKTEITPAGISFGAITGTASITETGNYTYSLPNAIYSDGAYNYTFTHTNSSANNCSKTFNNQSTTQNLTPTWSLSGATGYATVNANTGVINVTAVPANDLTITLTATVTYNGASPTATKEIVLVGATPATPTITRATGTNTITIATASNGATIRYTTDGSTPTCSTGTPYNGSFDITSVPVTINAVACRSGYASGVAQEQYTTLVIDAPTISFATQGYATLSHTLGSAVTIYYTLDGSTPTTSSSVYTAPVAISVGQTIKAFAVLTSSPTSQSQVVYDVYSEGGDGSSWAQAKHIYTSSALQNVESGKYYKVMADIDASGYNTPTFGSTPTIYLDGNYHKITGLTLRLFNEVTNSTIRNLIFEDIHVSSSNQNVGAIAGTASGSTRIYNCGILNAPDGTPSTVTGTNANSNVGSLVGRLNDNARVINCYSFANVSGGSRAAGIVGYNNGTAPTQANGTINSMVMNCMFYGDILSGTNKFPIYGGNHVQNIYVSNYNYYADEKLTATIRANSLTDNDYNSALAAPDKYLKRFEFYRGILNSNRRLVGWYISGNTADTALMAKWVLDTTIAEYPILKPWGKYPSVINRAQYQAASSSAIDASIFTPSTDLSVGTGRYEGRVLGKLKVNLNRGAQGSGNAQTIYLPITDMDTSHFDYCYYKVQLPYYNDYFQGNYGSYAVTGWDVSNVQGGTAGSVSTSGSNAYNYADRNCTAKDLDRTFAQGGFYYVPEGVTEITLTAHWGKAVYLADADNSIDRIFTGDGTSTRHTAPGTYTNNYGTNDTRFTSWSDAANSFNSGNSVYDNVIVMVSNIHSHSSGSSGASKPYSIMSIDENGDNEPDFCIYQEFNNREDIDPIRFDFVYYVGTGMAKKRNNSANYNSLGIVHPKGHYEETETCVAIHTEFEYDQARSTMAPLILNSGVVDQIVSAHSATSTKTQYVILGGHIWMKAYTPGVHADGTNSTNFAPVSIMGGDFDAVYLTGMRPDANSATIDGRIYTNGGHFKTYAASYQEQLKGNVYARFDHSVVWEFYGGGVNAQKPVTGDIDVVINNSMVTQYVGGPKFGYVQNGKTVTTNATGTVFGYYYGASYGGTSYYKPKTNDATGASYDFDWITRNFNDVRLNSGNNGILTGYEIEFFSYAGGRTPERRFYQTWATMSLSTTLKTTSTLNDCYVKHDFYGGGRIGKCEPGADGLVSTLNRCIVDGNAFGGGYSADIPTCEVMNTAQNPAHLPLYNQYTGLYATIPYPETVTYTWDNSIAGNVDQTNHLLKTTENLNDLGKVQGNTVITVNGGHIKGSLFGGGNASSVTGNTTVVLNGDAEGGTYGPAQVDKFVFGGGNQAPVGGNTDVTVKGESTVLQNVYGGGNRGNVGGNTNVTIGE